MQIQITRRSIIIGVVLGMLAAASMYSYVAYDYYQKSQYAKAVDTLSSQGNVVMDVKDGVVMVSPIK